MHWVGNGFPVKTLFSYHDIAEHVSPFLMLDYAGPTTFPPTQEKKGVGEHPHRGFETVTIVYSGEVEHRDSAGGGGKIGPGDVQWMTAGSGLVHEEFHGKEFAAKGGRFEMVQLWVNLPKTHKMTPPTYQSITKDTIPVVPLENRSGEVRVIAGEFKEAKGPAHTFSPVNVWDVKMENGSSHKFSIPSGYSTSLLVLEGRLTINEKQEVSQGTLAVFEWEGDEITLKAESPSRILILNGKPLNEPIVGHGPFVMNTEGEIRQAFLDFQSGRMGHLQPTEQKR